MQYDIARKAAFYSPKYRDYAINEIYKIANSNGTLQRIQDSIEQLSE